jgi:predicted transposase/invertase (TIGR01784 family)
VPYTKTMSLGLTNDYIFRYVFGRKESTPMLLDLVNAVLTDAGSRPVLSLELQNPVNPRDASWAKETVLDILAIDEDKRQFDIEMQVSANPYYANRSLYYWSQAYSRQLGKGHEYEELRPVVCINLLDFVLFDDTPENHHHYVITDARDPERQLTDDLHIHFVELCKDMHREVPLKWWAELFENAGVEGADMKKILSKDMLFAKAYEDLEYCKQNREMRNLALSRHMFQLDMNSKLGYALRKGLAEGRAEGEIKGKAEVVRHMLERGMGLDAIALATGMEVKELESLVTQK